MDYSETKASFEAQNDDLKRLSALGVGWISGSSWLTNAGWGESQTPFGFGGGLDRIHNKNKGNPGGASSQTPFGFGGGLDQMNEIIQQAQLESQTPFGFGGGLDDELNSFECDTMPVSNAFRLWGWVG